MADGGNAPVDRLVRHITGWLKGLRPVPLVATGVALMLVATSAYAAINLIDLSDPAPSGRTEAASGEELGFNTLDGGLVASDLSDVPDSQQNFLYGTDPDTWNTAGTPIPDAWLVRYGYDPLDPTVDRRPAAKPPVDALPAKYDNVWPAKFVPTLGDVYSYDRPSDWDEATDGPFHNDIDPTQWDNSGDGIPDGWLLHYGLDPLDDGIGDDRLAGTGGLSVLEAFQHNTDPTKTDSDGDGLTDKEEIAGPANPSYPDVGEPKFPPTDPSRFSTADAGVCDGYLVAHGLDPTDSKNSYRDLSNSGATTLEKFQWSFARDPVGACASGAGLDPLAVSTTGAAIPDGWLLRYGLSPLDVTVPDQVTGSSANHAGPWDERTLPPADADPEDGLEALPNVQITVLNEYLLGRPTSWDETVQGPWWGGTDPTLEDTDGDGLPDAVELRGYYVSVATDLGSNAEVRHYHVTSHPAKSDTSGDGLNDYVVVTGLGTDPNKRDTDLDGIPDAEEVGLGLGLDPLRADSAGDHLADGVRLEMLQFRAAEYQENSTYEYTGEPGVPSRKVTDWACRLDGVQAYMQEQGITAGGCSLSGDDLAFLFGPEGNIDGDADGEDNPIPNILDDDMDGDLLLNGWEFDPSLYDRAGSQFPSEGGIPRRATDAMNPDTDGDQLDDEWEIRNARPTSLILPDLVPPRYTLEPSVWSTLCDPVTFKDAACTMESDADQDLDDDGLVFTYFARDGGLIEAVTETIGFPALQEQIYQTDPLLPSTIGDGLDDGWKVFWAFEYPGRVAASGPDEYIHAPPEGDSVWADNKPALNFDQSATSLASGPYAYFTTSTSFPSAATIQSRGEVRTQIDDVPLAGGTKTIYKITGTEDFTMLDAQAARTNPYLAATGTAGHGVPDWWLWAQLDTVGYFSAEGECVAALLDMLDPGMWESDPDNDGLTVLEEFHAHAEGDGNPSTHPVCTSTTLTGFADGLMAGYDDPLDAKANAEDLHNNDKDTDNDGLPDSQERLGTLHLGQFIKTDPFNPDTDSDGLLDGPNVVLDSDPSNSFDAPWFRLYMDLGIVYNEQDGLYDFQGEMGDHQTHPLNPIDSPGSGVPVSWLWAYDETPSSAGADARDHYEFGMPSWWDLSIHGPWWGGVDPDLSLPSGVDLDKDGMDDVDPGTGEEGFEDPMPGANHHNAWRPMAWNQYPDDSDLGISEPAVETLPTDGSQTPLVQRLLAQSYLNPAEPGTHSLAFPSRVSLSPGTQEQPCLEFTKSAGLRNEADAPIDRLRKGEIAHLVGRVYDCDTEAGLPNITVDARMGKPVTQSFGAGFTDADGYFRVPINITEEHAVEIPAVQDVILRGNTSGIVRWTSDPSIVPATDSGQGISNSLKIRTYKTSDWASQKTEGLNQSTVPIEVEAGSVLRLIVPEEAISGESFPVEFQLSDTGGAPLQDSVHFDWAGGVTIQPDASGRGEVLLPTPKGLSGDQTISATSIPGSSYVDATTATTSILLRQPVVIDLDKVPSLVDPGEAITITGHVEFGDTNKGAAGIPVDVNITLAGDSIVGGQAISAGSGGKFSVPFVFPEGLPGGEYQVVATADATASSLGDTITEKMSARSTPHFDLVELGHLTQGEAASVSGRLVDFDTTPIPEATVDITLDGAAYNAVTDDLGRFQVEADQVLPGYPVVQTFTYQGNPLFTSASHQTERTVLSPTHLSIPNGELALGKDLGLPIRLNDGNGNPVPRTPVWVTWGEEDPVQALTGSDGVAHFKRPHKPDDETGTILVHAEHRGGDGSGYLPSVGTATWTVRSIAQFDLPAGSVVAGESIPPASLVDAGTGDPLAKVPVIYEETPNRGDGHVAKTVTTDADGRFPVLETINRSGITQIITLSTRFGGDEHYQPVESESKIIVQVPVELETDLPTKLVMGRETVVDVGVHSLHGNGVDDGIVAVVLGGTAIASAPVEGGVARINMTIPLSTASGLSILSFRFDDAYWYAPEKLDEEVELVRPVRLVIESDGGLPGEATTIRVTAYNGDEVLAFVPIHIDVEGIEGGMVETTDGKGVATFRLEQPTKSSTVAARFAGQGDLNPAHAVQSLVPERPVSVVERGVSILTWVLVGIAVILTTMAPIVYRLRLSPLEPVLRRARRILFIDEPDAKKILMVYRHLEEAALGQGYLKGGAQTARRLQGAIRSNVPAAAHPALGHLMDLFEMARYSEEKVGPLHSKQAVHAMDGILDCMRVDAGFRWPRRKAGRVGA